MKNKMNSLIDWIGISNSLDTYNGYLNICFRFDNQYNKFYLFEDGWFESKSDFEDGDDGIVFRSVTLKRAITYPRFNMKWRMLAIAVTMECMKNGEILKGDGFFYINYSGAKPVVSDFISWINAQK